MKLYKATRPDGTDFQTGKVNYAKALETGEVLIHPAKRKRNEPSTYYSVSTSPTDCTGMRWPCRLFEVEAVGRTIKNDDLPNKRCCSKLRVVKELPAHEALGPQGEEVAALIERCKTLTLGEVRELGAAWGAAWGAARDAARRAMRDATRDAAWGATRGAAWGATRRAMRDATPDAAWGATRGAAWGATWDAAWARLVRDLITEDQFDTLYGPWKKVIG